MQISIDSNAQYRALVFALEKRKDDLKHAILNHQGIAAKSGWMEQYQSIVTMLERLRGRSNDTLV